ncbi:amino acid ABC transporter permease [Jeotgalibaca sp. MA1X17-3]|uniref:amino acid ABC transporter permease n=1 Tax=Jeotgalibaca sp. MA1X17-3 TaxID=2908211 RepID=UPI001F2DBD2E|nr:amino acid ABC transporter permease [Jeotgalibaca sp. MA1X17-3]UJF16354.1 amino acid ABC transporter permease [Jeotgalibaca sp. MA1X17-3]
MIESIQNIFTGSNLNFLMSGLQTSLLISVFVVLASILFGSFLGLLRNYERIFFGRIAGFYIELFRNTPLLLWMLFCAFLIPGLNLVIKGSIALFLYTSAVVAEIVRGGLNAIPKGQFEAANSQGFSFTQTLWYIILPQTFKMIIPSLLSQVITTFKDTSFLAGLGILEFTRSGQIVLAKVTKTSEVFLIFGFLALVYFLISFTLSSIVRRWHKKNATLT